MINPKKWIKNMEKTFHRKGNTNGLLTNEKMLKFIMLREMHVKITYLIGTNPEV